MADQNIVAQIDSQIGTFFSQWNFASTLIVGFALIVLIYPLFVVKDPDIHPFLLARQAQGSPIRQSGESAVYRSTEIPYGYPLRSGLGIKDPGASKWTTGRDGDLRDVWRQAVEGAKKDDGSPAGTGSAKIKTILGLQKVIEHDLRDLTLDINVVGKHIQDAGGKKVAVCLSNSVELLCTVFAGAFYSFSPILVPYSQKPSSAANLLGTADFDTLIAEAGSVALGQLLGSNKSIQRIIWVVRAGSKSVDWSEVPEGVGGKTDVTTWHHLVKEKKAGSTSEVPTLDKDNEPLPIAIFAEKASGEHELIEYSQKNLLSATSALSSSLPRTQKLTPTDSILLLTPLTSATTATYTFPWLLLSLFSTSNLLLTSVSGPSISLFTATESARQLLKPTHIIADARAIPQFTSDLTDAFSAGGLPARYAHWRINRSIQAGIMPDPTSTNKPGYLPPQFRSLKTLYIAQPSSLPPKTPARIPNSTLHTLRTLLHARVSLAFVVPRVAGYVTQTNILDYRNQGHVNCVGAVASNLELWLVGSEEEMGGVHGVGGVVVKGPAVAGKKGEKVEVEGIRGLILGDNTLVLV